MWIVFNLSLSPCLLFPNHPFSGFVPYLDPDTFVCPGLQAVLPAPRLNPLTPTTFYKALFTWCEACVLTSQCSSQPLVQKVWPPVSHSQPIVAYTCTSCQAWPVLVARSCTVSLMASASVCDPTLCSMRLWMRLVQLGPAQTLGQVKAPLSGCWLTSCALWPPLEWTSL